MKGLPSIPTLPGHDPRSSGEWIRHAYSPESRLYAVFPRPMADQVRSGQERRALPTMTRLNSKKSRSGENGVPFALSRTLTRSNYNEI